jgi:hypothetical protein
VLPDGKSFFVTEFAIVDIVSNDLTNPEDIKKITKIYNEVVLTSKNDNEYVKFNETQNPDDIIKQVILPFDFKIILK